MFDQRRELGKRSLMAAADLFAAASTSCFKVLVFKHSSNQSKHNKEESKPQNLLQFQNHQGCSTIFNTKNTIHFDVKWLNYFQFNHWTPNRTLILVWGAHFLDHGLIKLIEYLEVSGKRLDSNLYHKYIKCWPETGDCAEEILQKWANVAGKHDNAIEEQTSNDQWSLFLQALNRTLPEIYNWTGY